MRAFGLWGKDPALDMVGKIVNHADTSPETSAYKMPEGDGLEAIARGFALITARRSPEARVGVPDVRRPVRVLPAQDTA